MKYLMQKHCFPLYYYYYFVPKHEKTTIAVNGFINKKLLDVLVQKIKGWREAFFFCCILPLIRSAHESDEKTVMMYIWFGSRVRLNDREYEAP